MVSLLCGCCAEKPITSLNVTRVFRCFFEINPITYRWYRKNENKQTQLMARLNASRYDFSLKDDVDLFKTLFYMANYHDYYWEQANVPLHMYSPDDDDDDTFYYKLGADFLTPFGNDTMVELPSASDMSSYLVPELLFDNPTSDFFYFFTSCVLDFGKCKSELDFYDPHCYGSSSPFFFVPGVSSVFNRYGSSPDFVVRLPFHSAFFNLCSSGFVYDFPDFFPLFKQGFLSSYQKFYDDVMACKYHKSCFSVFKFLKKDYYAYIQNNSTTR